MVNDELLIRDANTSLVESQSCALLVKSRKRLLLCFFRLQSKDSLSRCNKFPTEPVLHTQPL